jgi:DNA-directed RNA polymerase II subunit RPB2
LERLVRHQLESYNEFVGNQIERTIDMFNPVHIFSEQDYDRVLKKHRLEIVVEFKNFNLYRPQIHENNGATKLMFPQEARLRNFTYASSMTVDVKIQIIVRSGTELENVQNHHKMLPKIPIGKLPIMLKSNVCVLKQCQHMSHQMTGECKHDASKDPHDPYLYKLECPSCGKEGCDECMPAGRGCPCPECEDSSHDEAEDPEEDAGPTG